jgi:hypothetical protein
VSANTVTEKNWAGVTTQWDNRSEQAILHNDMALVTTVWPLASLPSASIQTRQ